jgi:hypothetical protein
VWVAEHPALLLGYLVHYAPSVAKFMLKYGQTTALVIFLFFAPGSTAMRKQVLFGFLFSFFFGPLI